MKRVAVFSMFFFYGLFLSAETGEILVNFFPGIKEKGVIGILRYEDNNKSAVVVRKDLNPDKYTFKVTKGRYLVICFKYSYNHSLQTYPIVVKEASVTEVECEGLPDNEFIELRGVVIDKQTGLPIAGAKVGDYPFFLPSELLPHYSRVVRVKTDEWDMGDVMRFLKKYNFDKHFYFLTDRKGRFKTFLFTKAISDFGINFSVFADGYAPFFYKKRVKDVSKIKSPLDVGTVELVPAVSFKLSLAPPLGKESAIYLEPINSETESFPRDYFVYSPYRRLGTSSKSPVFINDRFVWSFLYPWIYSVKWRIKKGGRGFTDVTVPLAIYEIKDENKEVTLDVNECEYQIEVVDVDNSDGREDFDISISWRDVLRVTRYVNFKDLKKPVRVRDIVKGKSFVETYIKYGNSKEIFIKEIGKKFTTRRSTTNFYSRVVMENCAEDRRVRVKLEDSELSFVIRDDRGELVKGASVVVHSYKKGYYPSFSCWTKSNEEGKALCKYLKSGEYLVLIRHPKGYFGPETFATSKDSYEVTLKKGKEIEVELLSPEYKSIGRGLVIVAALKDTPFSIISALVLEGEEAKPYRIVGPPSDKEERYVAKFSNLPYHDIYVFPETQITKLGKGWSRNAMLLDADREGKVQLVLGSGSGTVVFEGRSTGVGFDDGYVLSVCKKEIGCLPPSFFTPLKVFSSTGGFFITGLAPGEYKVKLVPIDLGENRKPLETPFFRIYSDQHTIIREGNF